MTRDAVDGTTGSELPVAPKAPERPGWIRQHRWQIGLAGLALAGLFWRRTRKRGISLSHVSQTWLMQHEADSGRDREL